MKKKELLVIFILAILVTAGSFARETLFLSWVSVGGGGRLYARGAPLPYYITNPRPGSSESPLMAPLLILDLFFWFLVLAGSWWLVKLVLKKVKRKK